MGLKIFHEFLVSLKLIKHLTFTSMKPVLQYETVPYNTRIFVFPYGINVLQE